MLTLTRYDVFLKAPPSCVSAFASVSTHATFCVMINMSVEGLERNFYPDVFPTYFKSTFFSNGYLSCLIFPPSVVGPTFAHTLLSIFHPQPKRKLCLIALSFSTQQQIVQLRAGICLRTNRRYALSPRTFLRIIWQDTENEGYVDTAEPWKQGVGSLAAPRTFAARFFVTR